MSTRCEAVLAAVRADCKAADAERNEAWRQRDALALEYAIANADRDAMRAELVTVKAERDALLAAVKAFCIGCSSGWNDGENPLCPDCPLHWCKSACKCMEGRKSLCGCEETCSLFQWRDGKLPKEQSND